ncbi:gp58-like family protein [Latilactobacillus curvatus]|uniref:gp58-like family protein n=1 Tax=Latilactobacillus curvatus TaxID=28038 RepID=UPI001F4FE4CF|nr:gp58-like family protein [Latilactobacillus curvatus]
MITVNHLMLTRANRAPQKWQQAPEDAATEVQFSQLQVTVNGIQGTVQNKADKSQVTQLSNQITSTVSQLGTPNYVYNPGFSGSSADGWGLGGVYYMSNNDASSKDGVTALGINLKNVGSAGTKTFKTAISKRMPYNGDLSQPISASVNIRTYEITGDVRWFFTIETFNDLTSGRVEYFSSNEITGAQSGWRTSAKLNAKPTKPFKYVAIAYQIAFHGVGSAHGMFCKPMMNFGPTVAPYTDSGISASQITQLANDINLRVQKGDVVNQINISPEGILIDGKKVHITGQTTIDNAVIKDAMIANVTADKITAGTINGANVNVINLNANNITTGTIKGANLSMNLNTGEVVFQHGRIHSASNNVDVNIDQGYLSVANADTRVLLKDGGIQFVQPSIFDHQANPYLDISNSGGAQSFHGASIVGRDFLSLANSANNTNMFTYPLGVETFAGISFGNANGRWNPTKIGGAERGIVLSAGAGMPSDMFGSSPSIIVGGNENRVAGGNRIVLDGEYVHIQSAYSKTASGGPNVIVAEDGALVRSTSASKYKTDIVRTNKSDYGDKLLNLPTATWTDIAETKRYQDNPTTQPKPTRNFGMIAEDLADAGLEMLVVRGTDGELEGINYDRIGPALIPVIAKLKNEVEILKRKIGGKSA